MEYRNIIEELMDTKVKELLDKPFGAVMNMNNVVRYDFSNITEFGYYLDKRLWQEILSNEKVASLDVIEKWENIYGGEFLVLDSSEDVMSGIIIFVDGTINYTHFSTTAKDDGPWEMSRLKGNKLGNYYSSFDEIYFEDLMPDEIY